MIKASSRHYHSQLNKHLQRKSSSFHNHQTSSRIEPYMGRADLHMHTLASDGIASVQQLLHHVEHHRPHLDVIAITDHDTIDAALWAYEHRDCYRFDIIPGIEVTSRAGHILGLWVKTPIPAHMNLHDTVAAIREAGGLAILAHPFHLHLADSRRHALRYLSTPEVLLQAGISALEAHNAGMIGFGWNSLASWLAKRIGLAVTGGSDAHTLGAIGCGVTRFAGRSADDLRRALQNAETIAEGQTWRMRDYIKYFNNERQRRATTSLANTI
jgi:predicted metal-dependent phosphoesterase TrpH